MVIFLPYHSMFHIYPDKGTGIFISLNGDGKGSPTNLRSNLMGDLPTATPRAGPASRCHVMRRAVCPAGGGSYINTRAPFSTYATAWVSLSVRSRLFWTMGLMVGEKGVRDGRAVGVAGDRWFHRIAAQVEDGKVGADQGNRSFLHPWAPSAAGYAGVDGSSLALLVVIVTWPHQGRTSQLRAHS